MRTKVNIKHEFIEPPALTFEDLEAGDFFSSSRSSSLALKLETRAQYTYVDSGQTYLGDSNFEVRQVSRIDIVAYTEPHATSN